jgi:hypothetical protein
MPLTTDHHEIQAALTRFGINQEDYYLVFDTNAIYMVWCTKGPKALDLVKHEECIDIDIKGEWFCYEELPPAYEPDPLVCVRYILNTN